MHPNLFNNLTPHPVQRLFRPDSTNLGVFALSLPTNREKSFDHRDSIKSIERSEAKTTPFKTTDENGDDRIPPRRPWTDGRPRSIDRGLSSSSSSSSSSSTTRPHFHTLLAKRIASSSSSHPRLNYRALDSVRANFRRKRLRGTRHLYSGRRVICANQLHFRV